MDSRTVHAARVDRWRDRLAAMTFTDAQAEGWACVACGHDHGVRGERRPFVPVGFGPRGQVFVCVECDKEESNG